MDDILIDIFRTVVSMKAEDSKRISIDEFFENGNENVLSDLLNGGDEFELRDLVGRNFLSSAMVLIWESFMVIVIPPC